MYRVTSPYKDSTGAQVTFNLKKMGKVFALFFLRQSSGNF